MGKIIKGALCALLCLAFTACAMLTPEQKASIRTTVQSEYELGNITQAQRDATIEALDNDKPIDWTTLGLVGMNILLGLVGGPMVVRMNRGPATQKVGLPQSKVKPAT